MGNVMALPRFVRALVALALVLTLSLRPAMAQSVLRDTETEEFLQEIAAPLMRAAGLDPRNAQVLLVNDPEINAFVVGGQTVFINSGLLTAADNVNQVQGVIAHELGHIEGGHVVRFGDGMKEATAITLLSLVLGAAVMAAGGGEAGMGILGAGQQAAQNKFLAYSRAQESSADQAGARYLSQSGISGKGSIEFFKKLRNLEYRYRVRDDQDDYSTTHPLTNERISILSEMYEKDPAWNHKTPPALEARFARIKAKLFGFVSDPEQTLRTYPKTDLSIPAHYARAYAWHKSAYPQQAQSEADALLALNAHDPYFLELKGQILLEGGKPGQAIAPLREAVRVTGAKPMIATLLGHALVATENPANYAEAEQVLRASINRDRDQPFAWYVLGMIFEHRGDTARAALASAERFSLTGDNAGAKRSADAAMQALTPGTADYLRAQDISMAAKADMDNAKRGKGGKNKDEGKGGKSVGSSLHE